MEMTPQEWKGQYAALIGLDWGDTIDHHFRVIDAATGKHCQGQFPNTPEAMNHFIQDLMREYPGRTLALCLEDNKVLRGGLMKYECLHLYPTNPSKIDSFRESYVSSGAKDNPSDAFIIAMYLDTWGNRLRVWTPDDSQTRLIGELAEDRRGFVDDRTAFVNCLKATLKRHFPQALEILEGDVKSPKSLAFLKKWPALQSLKRARKKTLGDFFDEKGFKKIEEKLELIREAVALVTDESIICSASMKTESLVTQIEGFNKSIEKYEQKLEELIEDHPDAKIFENIKGAGKAIVPRLISAMGSDRDRWESSAEIQQLQGIAPVVERSGTTRVHWRWAAPKFLRQTWVEFADQTRKFEPWAKAYYWSQRAKGKKHQSVLRSLAFKWIRVLYRCWKNDEAYSSKRYIESLRKTGSPILKYMEENGFEC